MTYKIIDMDGNTVQKGFKNEQVAVNILVSLKIHKREKLEVVEEK